MGTVWGRGRAGCATPQPRRPPNDAASQADVEAAIPSEERRPSREVRARSVSPGGHSQPFPGTDAAAGSDSGGGVRTSRTTKNQPAVTKRPHNTGGRHMRDST